MNRGKYICNTLKQVRLDIARANGIKYAPRECHHEGECAGTCPACESEMRFLVREIVRRRSLGKAALVAGVSLNLMSFTATSCNQLNKADNDVLQGEVELVEDSCEVTDSIKNSSLKDSLSEKGSAAKGNDVQRITDLPIVGEVASPLNPPSFPGGENVLRQYIMNHIVYPEECKNVSGKVIIQFQVDEKGSVTMAKIVESVHPKLDAEVIRVIKSLPKFDPAKNDEGQPVSSWLTLPVTFVGDSIHD